MKTTHWVLIAVGAVAALSPLGLSLTQSGVPTLVKVGIAVSGAAAIAVQLKSLWQIPPS